MKTARAPGPWRRWFAWYPVVDEWGNGRFWEALECRWNPAKGDCGGWEYRTPK